MTASLARPATSAEQRRYRTRPSGLVATLALLARPRYQFWTTPRLVRLLLAAIVVMALALGGLTAAGLRELRLAIETMAYQQVSSILSAVELRAMLADMDANAANDLLVGTEGSLVSRALFDERRRIVSARLVAMGETLAFGEEDRRPVIRLVDQSSYYVKQVGRAQELNRIGRGEEARLVFREATALMHEVILPAADQLVALNSRYLEQTYARHGQIHSQLWTLLLVGGGVLLALLIVTQVLLTLRMRRLLNLPLLLATLLTLAGLIWLMMTLTAERAALRRAREEALASVVALWQARAFSFDANGYESLYLLYPAEQQLFQRGFDRTMGQVLNRPVDSDTLVRYYQSLVLPAEYTGALAEAARGINFVGEREAVAWALLQHWLYLDIDGRIRLLDRLGLRAQAIALCVGIAPGESKWAFEQFDRSVADMLAVNQQEYEQHLMSALGALGHGWWLTPLGALLVISLAWLGLAPRLNEYAVAAVE
jgi:hypothetical protein